MEPNKRDLELLFEIGSLRNVQRGWRQHLGMDCANILDHSMRVIWIALMIARMEGVKNEEKIIKMALVHDIPETRVSDLSYIPKVYVTADEDTAAKEIFDNTSFGDFYTEILKEFEERQTIEAKIVKDADNLDVEVELKELEERGSKLPKKWANFRKMVCDEKLYTQSAKRIWEHLQNVEIADWHLLTNKWLRIPDAGK